MIKVKYTYILFFNMFAVLLCGQIEQDSSKRLIQLAENAVKVYIEEVEIDSLRGNVRIRQDSIYLFADTAIIRNQNHILAYSNVAVIQNDTIEVFCDSLRFQVDTGDADFMGHVVFKNQRKLLKTERLQYNTETRIARYNTPSILRDSSSLLRSRKGIYFLNEEKVIFTRDVQIIDTAFTLRTDSLIYNTENRFARYFGPSEIEQDGATIYCNGGEYDLNKSEAVFRNNVQFVQDTTRASSELLIYDGKKKEYFLEGNAKFISGAKRASSDQLIYNKQEDRYFLTGNARFKEDDFEVEGDQLVIDGKTQKLETNGRSTIVDDNSVLTANTTAYDGAEGKGIAVGDVIWEDTLAGYEIWCDDLKYDKERGYANMVGTSRRPVFVNYGKEDTLYISADTLLQRRIITDTMNEKDLFIGDNNVQIFSNEFLAVADSLVYNTTDSTFVLLDNPIMWLDSTQFIADTIFLFFEDGNVSKMELRNRSFITVMKLDGVYDQIKGKNVDAFLKEGKMKEMHVRKNCETIYYMQDDEDKFIGASRSTSDEIEFYFENNELIDIKYVLQPQSSIKPIGDIDPYNFKLEGFRWDINQKPTSSTQIRTWQ